MLETGVLAQSERFREVSQGPKSVRGSVISSVLSGFAMGKAALRTAVFCKTFGRPQTEPAEEVACTGEGVVALVEVPEDVLLHFAEELRALQSILTLLAGMLGAHDEPLCVIPKPRIE